MNAKSQLNTRRALLAVVAVSMLPGLGETYAVIWGQLHGMAGKALRDGLDFWAGGFLALHHQSGMLFDPVAYQGFLQGAYGKLPEHMWSYPPNYLLLAAGFGWLAPWHAVLTFDALSLALLAAVLRLAKLPWVLIAAVALSPVSIENILEGQNAALLTALIGGGLLLLPARPRLGGGLIGLASVKPQLGLVLPLFLLRRCKPGFAWAALAALLLAAAALAAFGPGVWEKFWIVTRPAMGAVLLTGEPKDFANGLISVFATVRLLGVPAALAVQGLASLACIGLAWRSRDAVAVLVLAALASPYLHDYDLLGVALAVALMVRDRLATGFGPGEPLILFLAWFGPGALPWLPQFAHATPVVLVMLLAIAWRRGPVAPCDSLPAPPGSPALSAGRSPIPAHPGSTGPGLPATE